MHTRVINWIILLLLISLCVNLVNSWWHLYQRGDVIKEAENKLSRVQEKQEELKRNLAKAQSSEYIEIQARDKLNLSREGETVVILPQITPVIEMTPTPSPSLANWEKWVNLFR